MAHEQTKRRAVRDDTDAVECAEALRNMGANYAHDAKLPDAVVLKRAASLLEAMDEEVHWLRARLREHDDTAAEIRVLSRSRPTSAVMAKIADLAGRILIAGVVRRV